MELPDNIYDGVPNRPIYRGPSIKIKTFVFNLDEVVRGSVDMDGIINDWSNHYRVLNITNTNYKRNVVVTLTYAYKPERRFKK